MLLYFFIAKTLSFLVAAERSEAAPSTLWPFQLTIYNLLLTIVVEYLLLTIDYCNWLHTIYDTRFRGHKFAIHSRLTQTGSICLNSNCNVL